MNNLKNYQNIDKKRVCTTGGTYAAPAELYLPERHLATGGQTFLFVKYVEQKEQNTHPNFLFAAGATLTVAPEQTRAARGKLLIYGVALGGERLCTTGGTRAG